LTYVFTVHPTGIAARIPASAAAQAPSTTPMPSFAPELGTPAIAIELRIPADEVPASRPATAPAATAPAATAPAATATAAPTAAASRLVALPALTIDVWKAEERYFSVVGSTPDEIVASAMASVPADPTGAERGTMAYAGPIVWDHRPSYVQDPATGSCTMTALASNVAYQATLPQWTASSGVPRELHAWWLVVLDHIRLHESQHIRIFEDYVSALPARIVGQPCSAWDAIIAQWSAELVAAQSAFDAVEAGWQLPTYTGPLDW